MMSLELEGHGFRVIDMTGYSSDQRMGAMLAAQRKTGRTMRRGKYR
jgi:hypothetical protein